MREDEAFFAFFASSEIVCSRLIIGPYVERMIHSLLAFIHRPLNIQLMAHLRCVLTMITLYCHDASPHRFP